MIETHLGDCLDILPSIPVSNPTTATPAPVPTPKPANFKLDINSNGMTLVLFEKLLPGAYSLFSNSPSWEGKLVNKENG